MYKVIAAIGVAISILPFVYSGGDLFNEYEDLVFGFGAVFLFASGITYYESKR